MQPTTIVLQDRQLQFVPGTGVYHELPDFGLSNELVNSLAHLVAVYGDHSISLACTSAGALKVDLSAAGAFPGLTDVQLRAAAVPVSGPLTDTQLRAAAVPVSGPVTDTQLRATAVPVSGPVTDTQLRAAAVPVSGPVTDTQLRATAVPVSGPLTVAELCLTTVAVYSTEIERLLGPYGDLCVKLDALLAVLSDVHDPMVHAIRTTT